MKKVALICGLLLIVGCGRQVDVSDIQIEVLDSGVEVVPAEPEIIVRGIRILKSAVTDLNEAEILRLLTEAHLKNGLAQGSILDYRLNKVMVSKSSCRASWYVNVDYDVKPKSMDEDWIRIVGQRLGGGWIGGSGGMGQMTANNKKYWIVQGFGGGGGGGSPCYNEDGSEEVIERMEWKSDAVLEKEKLVKIETKKRYDISPKGRTEKALFLRNELLFEDNPLGLENVVSLFQDEKLFWQWMGFDGFLQNSLSRDEMDGLERISSNYVIDDGNSFHSGEREYLVTLVSDETADLKKSRNFEQKYFLLFEDEGEGWRVKDIYATKRPLSEGYMYLGNPRFTEEDIESGLVVHFEEDQRKGEGASELGRLPETKEEFLGDKWFLWAP